MNNKWLLIPLALVSTSSLASKWETVESFGYNSVYTDIGAGTTNEDWLNNSNETTLGLGGNYLLNDRWILNADYSAQFFHPEDITIRVDRLTLGGGYRYPIRMGLDVYGMYGIGALKSKITDDDTDRTLESVNEMLQTVRVGGNFVLTRELVANIEAKFSRSDWADENAYRAGLNYQWHRVIGTGVFYNYRETDNNYINEVGVRFQFLY